MIVAVSPTVRLLSLLVMVTVGPGSGVVSEVPHPAVHPVVAPKLSVVMAVAAMLLLVSRAILASFDRTVPSAKTSRSLEAPVAAATITVSPVVPLVKVIFEEAAVLV